MTPTHNPILILIFALLLILAGGCDLLAPAPTLPAPLELTTPTPRATRRASPTPRRILSPTARPTATPTLTPSPTLDPLFVTPTPEAPQEETLDPVILTQIAANQTATLAPDQTLIGRSVEERRIVGHRLGRGPQMLLLVGGIHGGWELNTIDLMDALLEHFSAAPEAIAPGVQLVIVTNLNPDGLVEGRTAAGRFNANGVDLNRNWGCAWEPDAVWGEVTVDPGPEPFSEPESAALADYILLHTPAAVVFYHSAANGVFAGSCNGDHGSQELGHTYGRAATYPSNGHFNAYRVTGDASNWVDGQGIPAITVELAGWNDPEFERNLAGVMAVQCRLAEVSGAPGAEAWRAEYCAE